MMNELDTEEILNGVVKAVTSRHIDVQLVDSDKDGVEIGELKQGRITLNVNARDELSQTFTIAHLFGHFNQFRNYRKYKHLIEAVEKPVPIELSSDFKKKFWEYEREAFGIGKSLMLEAFPVDKHLDNLYQTFMITDFEHFWHYISTGRGDSIVEFNKRLKKNYEKNIIYDYEIKPIPIPKHTKGNILGAEVKIY